MKCYIPAAICLIGMLSCCWLGRRKAPEGPHYSVEIVVYGPDGKVIPAVRRSER